MTSIERMYALYLATHYVCAARIPGDIVECGVWRGGSSMLAAMTLLACKGSSERDLYLYDTYSGMTEPEDMDVDAHGRSAKQTWHTVQEAGAGWCSASVDEVRKAMSNTGYPSARLHYIQGRVEETIPRTMAERIAILRLDTDWYSSTKHELNHLYPRLAQGGVLIIDDYGHWQGARLAVDEYLAATNTKMLLTRVDYTGRVGIKP